MSYRILIIILFIPALVAGQTVKPKSDTVRCKEAVNQLLSTWNLGLTEEGDETANIREFNKFKNLFWPQATIFNDINAYFDPESSSDKTPYKVKEEMIPVEDYAHSLALEFKNLKIEVDTSRIQYDYNSLDQNIIKVTFQKEISGHKRCEYIISDKKVLVDNLIRFKNEAHAIEKAEEKKDSIVAAINFLTSPGKPNYGFRSNYQLQITMVKNGDTIKISNITKISSSDTIHFCTNDLDLDGIVDVPGSDNCPNERGDFTAMGCLDSDLDGIPDMRDKCRFIYGEPENEGCPLEYFTTRFDVSLVLGLQANSVTLKMPALDQLGYEMDQTLSTPGSLSDTGLIISPLFSADLAWFFNKSKRMGLSIGISNALFNSTYKIKDSAVYTFKAFDGNDYYRRRITLKHGSSETINYSILNFPLLLKYRYRSSKLTANHTIPNWYLEFSAGPSLLLFNTTSKYNANLDFEGIYQVDTATNSFVYTDFDPSSTLNVWFTEEAINEQAGYENAAAIFASLNEAGYDFALDQNKSGTAKNKGKFGVAFNASVDACYKFDDNGRLAFKFGANVLFAPSLPGQTEPYKLVDKTSDTYNPIYNGQPTSTYMAFGIHAGLVLEF